MKLFARFRPKAKAKARPDAPRAALQGGNDRLGAFAERMPWLYLAITATLAAMALLWLLLPPLAAVVFAGRASVFALAGKWLQAFVSGGIALLGLLFTILYFRVRPAQPELPDVPRASAPRLHELVVQVQQQYRAPPMQRVLADESVDVTLVHIPFCALPVRLSHVLVVGLPAMQLMSPLHFRGLVVRRIGQATWRGHLLTGALTALRDIGPALLRACPSWRRLEGVLLRLFFVWFVPLYARWSVPAARIDELYADRCMMDSINDIDVAELLGALTVAQRYLREIYFPSVCKLARTRPQPPPIAYSGLERKFNHYWSDAQAKRWLQQAFAAGPTRGSVQPPLRRRLHEIGHLKPRMPPPLRQAASRVLLGSALRVLILKLDGSWMRRITPYWRELHEAAKRDLQRVRVLHEKSRKQRLELNEARELASLVERCFGKRKAVPFYKRLLEQNPTDANVSFAVGRFLLSTNDIKGIEALQQAMRLDERFSAAANGLIDAFRAARQVHSGNTGLYRAT